MVHLTPYIRSHFPLTFCINLARRTDRWAFMQSQFKQAGMTVTRFDGIDGSALPSAVVPVSPPLKWPLTEGPYACLLSHLSVISLAQNMGLPAVLVFEDDAQIDPSFTTRMEDFMRSVPADWDMIYLGGAVMLDKVQISDLVWRPSYVYNMFAYAVRDRVYQKCIDALRTKRHWNDQLIAGLHPQMNVYMPIQRFVRQRTDLVSDNKPEKKR